MTSSVSGSGGQPTPLHNVSFVQTGAPTTTTTSPGKLAEHEVIAHPKPHPDGIRNHEGLQNTIQLSVESIGTQDPSSSPKLPNTVSTSNISFEVQEAEARATQGRPEISFEAVPIPNDLPNSIQIQVDQGEAQPIQKGRVSSQLEEQLKQGRIGQPFQLQGNSRFLDAMNKALDMLDQWNRSHYGG